MIRTRWSRPAAPPAPPPRNAPRARKPRILVAGEFSAGKTQLINGLAGERVLPSNVTATALPPIWLTTGDPALMRVDSAAEAREIAGLDEVDLDATQYCLMTHPAPILTRVDIIDTPGNSDPNMAAETWQRMLTFADAVVWCTNATQAWRQSEKAVWQAMPDRLKQKALLIVTHADLLDPRDAAKVQRRVEREAGLYFGGVRMAALLEAGDIESINADILKLAEGLDPAGLGGAANALSLDFAASHPVVAGADKAELRGKVLQMFKTGAPAAPSEQVPSERAPSGPAADAGGAHEVIRLDPKPARPTRAARTSGRAGQLWNELAQGLDLTDPAAILAATDKLIAALDASGTVSSLPVRPGRAPAGEM